MQKQQDGTREAAPREAVAGTVLMSSALSPAGFSALTSEPSPVSSPELLRFVRSPISGFVPDLEENLPGEAVLYPLSVTALLDAVHSGELKLAAPFGPGEKAGKELIKFLSRELRRKVLDLLGLARASGDLFIGLRQIEEVSNTKKNDAASKLALFFEASDVGADGALKLSHFQKRGTGTAGRPVCRDFSREELSLALGRENVIHGAVRDSALAERLRNAIERLGQFGEIPVELTPEKGAGKVAEE